MAEKLEKGSRIETIWGEAVVNSWLGEGGQGDVYCVTYNGMDKALKWYKPSALGQNPAEFYANLEQNVRNGPPSEAFLWPLDITKLDLESGSFGYIMDLKPEGYYEVSDFMLTNVRFSSYGAAVDAALKIVSAYRILHNKGYCYQDLNDGNFFIHPVTGDVRIADNDNVVPNGTRTGVIGKPRYMAPEIVTGKAETPDTQSDLFSLAVIVFILLFLNHPLEGKRSLAPALTPAHQERLYGTHPLFIMDSNNDANAPDPVIHRNVLAVWPCLPEYMRELFSWAFSQESLTTPHRRPNELDWMRNLVKFRSEIVKCPCGNEIFFHNEVQCDKCGRLLQIPYALKLRNSSIPGVAGSRVYRCQLETCNADKALDIVGRVVAKRTDPTKLALKNVGETSWSASTPDGKEKRVAPGDGVPLKAGIRIVLRNWTSAATIEIVKNTQEIQNY